MKLFTGNANLTLANMLAKQLNIDLGKALVSHFSDGEIRVEIQESVRGQEVFILQSTCHPCNDTLMELMIMADAMRRASAINIIAVIPYFGYARQDRRIRSMRVPISAKVVADMLASVGINRIITLDLHADQIQGFFHMPVDNVYAAPIMLPDIRKKNINRPAIVSPDVGGVVRARAIAKQLVNADLSIIDKRRAGPNQIEVMSIIGDVNDRHCILIDDMIDTATTLKKAADILKRNGARSILAYCTHPILSGKAIENIETSAIDEIVVLDTIPLSHKALSCAKIRQLSSSELLAEIIYRVNHKQSVNSIFADFVTEKDYE